MEHLLQFRLRLVHIGAAALMVVLLWGMVANAQTRTFSGVPNLVTPNTPINPGSDNLEFIPNRGQIADQFGNPMSKVLYTMASGGMRIDFTQSGMQFIFSRVLRDSSSETVSTLFDPTNSFSESHKNDSIKFYRLDLEFEGANPNPRIEAVDSADDYTNYYFPWCQNGITQVPAYHKIIYHDLYPHIDLVLYSKAGTGTAPLRSRTPDSGPRYPFEYDFLVHPGGNPSQIWMKYANPDSLNLDQGGDATISTILGYICDKAPYAYLAGSGTPIASSFQVSGSTLQFTTARYDSSESLIIDPPRLWGTYYGGPTWDGILDVTADKDDNIIAAGTAQSASGISSPGAFQTALAGSQDAFIVKLSPAGSRIWATYYGGGSEQGTAVITDQSGNVYLGGATGSTSGIATPGAFQTTPGGGFLVKFDPSGTRIWGTYYDGEIGGLSVDSSSNICMTGTTFSLTGIATAGTHQTSIVAGSLDAFLTSFTPAGARRWGTYFGGVEPDNSGKGYTQSYKVAVALDGDILIAGLTQDTVGIATPGTFDTLFPNAGNNSAGFAARFTDSGQLVWATYVGDTNYHLSQRTNLVALACDRGIGAIISGGTNVSGLATSGAYQSSFSGLSSGFLMRLDSVGKRAWGTYLDHTLPLGIAIDKSYDVVIGGATASTTGVASPGEYQVTEGGSVDAFIMKFTTAGTFHWGTYYGGTGQDDAYGFVLDREGHPIIAGYTTSTNAMASPGSFESTYPASSSQSGFIAKFCDTVHAPLFFSAKSNSICYGERDTLTAGAGFTNYQWKQNGTIINGATTNKYILPVLSPGTYTYTMQVVDPDACASNTDTLPIIIHSLPVDSFANDVSICSGSSILIGDTARGAGPPFIYAWTPANGLDHPDSAEPIASPLTTTKYYLFVTDTNGCELEDSVTVHVNPVPHLNAGGNKTICYGDSVPIGNTATLGTPPFTYSWSPSNGLSGSTQSIETALPTTTTKYFEQVTDANGCEAIDSVIVMVNSRPHPPILLPQRLCSGNALQIGGAATGGKGPYHYQWSPGTGLSNPTSATPNAAPSITTTYTVIITDANGCDTTAKQTVNVFPLPTPFITADSTTVYCLTDSARLDAGPGYDSYVWSNGAAGETIAVPAGTYTVTVTDSNGCSGTSAPITITEVAPPAAVVSGPASECPNSVAVYRSLDRSIGSYSWSLSGGGTIQGSSATDSAIVDWTTPGTWQLSLHETMDAGGCSRDTTLSITITDSLEPSITQNGPSTICTGDTVKLSANSGYDSYQWSDGETGTAIEATSTGDYWVHVTNASGCSGTSAPLHIIVLADSVPHPVLVAANTQICAGDSVPVTTTQRYSSYRWNTGLTSDTIWISKAGTYSVTVTNADGCPGTSAPISFTLHARPKIQLGANGATTFCEGDSVTLSATPGFHYTWWNGGSRLSETAETIVVKSSGSYAVSATDNFNCDSTTAPIAVTVNPLPIVNISGPSSICIDGRAGYRIEPVPGSSILWEISPPGVGTIMDGQNTDSITVQWGSEASGSLEAAVTDSNGCTGTATLPISINSHLTPMVTPPGPISLCPGDSVTLDAGSGYASYQWLQNGNQIPSATNEFLPVDQTGTYTVFVTSVDGCNGTSQGADIRIYPSPAKPIIAHNGGQLVSSPAASYRWFYNGIPVPGDTTQTIVPDSEGSYVLTITDSNGCSATSDPVTFTNSGTVTVMLPPSSRANPGQHISIPLTLLNPQNVIESGATTYAGSVSFNATMLASQGPLGTSSSGIRTVPISGTLPSTLTSGMALTTLDFIANLGTDTCTSVTIDTFYFPNANINVTTEDGNFCLNGVCMDGGRPRLIDPNAIVSLSQVRPNPVNSIAAIGYRLSEEGPTKLYVQDMLGRTVMVLLDQWMKPGAYSSELNAGTLPSGPYQMVLRTPSDVLTERVEVVK